MDQHLNAFFKAYQEANSNSDFAAIGELYAETFLFAGPHEVRSVNKEDFLKVLPRMKMRFAALGLAGSCASSVEAAPLDSIYTLTRVRWTMTLRTSATVGKSFDTFATYILRRDDHGQLTIVFQLDHQDLAAVIQYQLQH